MWILTVYGFFSAVASDVEPNKLLVRARAKMDLENLRDKYLPMAGEIYEWKKRDYPYRLIVDQDDFAKAMAEMIRDINYTNFKDAVTHQMGRRRHDVYMRVWGILRRGIQFNDDGQPKQTYYLPFEFEGVEMTGGYSTRKGLGPARGRGSDFKGFCPWQEDGDEMEHDRVRRENADVPHEKPIDRLTRAVAKLYKHDDEEPTTSRKRGNNRKKNKKNTDPEE